MKPVTSATDCRSEEGITTGLVDAVIAIARILRPRLEQDWPPAATEAIRDLRQDEDVLFLLLGKEASA